MSRCCPSPRVIFVQILVILALLQRLDAKCSVTSQGVSKANIKTILKAHNTLRAKLANGKQQGQPGASNMKELTWNAKLAKEAQKLANKCQFQHEIPKVSPYKNVGQNLAISMATVSSKNAAWNSPVKDWYSEVKDFKRQWINPYKFSDATGHYTQVVWATTTKVGCGYASFKEGGWYKKLYVCNYGEGGNVIGTAMYKTGKACSKCKKCSKTYPGLCSS